MTSNTTNDMTKRVFVLSLSMILAVVSAWGEHVKVSATQTTIWEFSSQTANETVTSTTNLNSLYLKAKSNTTLSYTEVKRSGTFSDESTWSTTSNNASGVALYLASNSNLTPTSSYFSDLSAEGNNRTSRSVAFETAGAGKIYIAIYIGSSTSGSINLYKVASEETIVRTIDVATGLSAQKTATIEYETTEAGIFVLGSKDANVTLCYMKFVPEYSITIATGLTGGTISANKTLAGAGETITLSNVPASGYSFDSYSVTDANSDAVTVTDGTFIMPASNVNVTATFTAIDYTVQSTTHTNGSVTFCKEENGTYTETITDAHVGETIYVKATANDNYQFESLTSSEVDNLTSAATTSFTMPAKNVDITATFTASQVAESSVSTEQTWTFDNVPVGNNNRTATEIISFNNAYLRCSTSPNRYFTLTPFAESQTISFSDGYTINATTSNKYLVANGKSANMSSITSDITAASASTTKNSKNEDELIASESFAINAAVPGTFYALLSSTSADKKLRIYTNSAPNSPKTVTPTSTDITEVAYTATSACSFFVSGVEAAFNIYAVRFVPATTVKVPTGLTGGAVTADKTTANENDEVTLTVTPAEGYHLKDGSLKAYYISTDGTETEVAITNNKFTKPAYYVYVKAEFEENTAPTVTTAPAAATPTYTGEAQNLVTAGEVTGGTIYFSTTSATEGFDTTIPQGTNAGSYNVWWKVVGDETHTDLASTQIENVTIAKATLTATADNKNKTVGEANPELTVTVTGFVNEETAQTAADYVAPTASTEATTESPAGEYTITVSGGSANNYDFQYTNGTLTVTAVTPVNHTINGASTENGIALDKESATAGETVTITITIPEGKQIVGGKPTVMNGETSVEVSAVAETTNQFTFEMPDGDVTVSVSFEDIPSVYGTYDFQSWAEANMTEKNQATIELSNGVMTGTFTPASGSINGTMTLNGAFSITGSNASNYKLRKNGSSGNSSSGLMISNTSGAKLTINRLQAGDWFKIKTDVAERLAFAADNANVHKAGSTETITKDSYVESEAIYVVTGATTVDVYNKASGATYIHYIEISNAESVPAPTITVSGSNEVTISGESLKGNPVTIYYTTDNTDPKTSESKQTYSAPFTPTETAKIRAYAVLTSDNAVVSAEAEPAVVRLGTWTGETNVFDFASAANNYVDIEFGATKVDGIKFYAKAEQPSNEGNFYPITNTDWLTASTGNTAVISCREASTTNFSFADGGMKVNSYFAISGLTEGQRVKITFDARLRYRTNEDNDAPVMQYNGADVTTDTYFGTTNGTDQEIIFTVKSGSYMVFLNNGNTVIKNISVLAPVPTYTLTVNYDTQKGSVTNGDVALAESYQEGTVVSLKATPAEGYQFAEWTDADDHRLSLKNPYDVTINANTTIKAVFKQPTTPAIGITAETTWTFDGLTAGTDLSGTQVYELDGLYISGHKSDGSSPAKVVAGTSATDTQIAGEVTNYVQFAGGSTSSLASKEVTEYVTDKAAFKAGAPGVVSVFTGANNDRKFIIEVNGATTQNQYSNLDPGLQTKDVTEASNVFIGTTAGAGFIYAIKFTPETVTAPQISVTENVGTITAGTSNLTDDNNIVIKTYYTIDGTEPTNESLLYEGVIMASGTDITVKAISINTVTGTTSAVTTETGLTLSLPSKTLTVSAGEGGSVTWKISGATENTTETSFEQGTSIELTATPAEGYMFESWTSGNEVVSKTPVYTVTLLDNMTLTANFRNMGNKVPVILTAGQSNTDGRIEEELPSSFTGLANCKWSYANAKSAPAGTFNNKVWEIGDFVTYTPTSDTGTQWAYDAVVYDKIGKNLGSDFYVIKQSKGNTGISPASGGCGLFWSANPLWMSRTTSANDGGLSLLKALTDHIDASLERIPSGKTADIKFLMWHQGEGDGNGSQGPVYYQQMKAVINHVRNHLAQKDAKYSNLPFILGGITSVSEQYNAEVEAAKQQLANEDANVYYVSADGITADGLKSDVLHFNAEGGQTFGERVWQTIYDNNLLLGLQDGTGSSTPVATGLEEVEPISETTEWTFTNLTAGTEYSEKTNINGLYLQAQSNQKITVKDDNSLRVPAADRSAITTYGLTAGDALGTYHIVGVNTAVVGTFTATVAPDTEPTDAQAERNMFLVFNGEKVDTKNVRTVWNGSDDHKTTLTYRAMNSGTFFLTSAHAYRIYNVTFTPTTFYTLTVTQPSEGGSIQIDDTDAVTADYAQGTEVTLTAVPAAGYEFSYWTVDGEQDTENTTNTLTLTMNAVHSVTAVFSSGNNPTTAITIHTIGDSTMSSYDQSIPAQKGMDGWGDYLADCMKSEWVTVYNWADRGETAKSYYNGIWTKTSTDRPEFLTPIADKVNAGDYVIIQFGHNDSKAYSTVQYENWLGTLVDAVVAKGATPILAGSICRARFDSNGQITRLGRIDTYEDSGRILEDGATVEDSTFNYPYHAKQVAIAKNIEYIDVTGGVREMFETYGEAKTKALFPSGEKTHTNKLGAQLIAKVAARLLLNTAIANYVDQTTLALPDADDIDVVIDDFGTDATVTRKTIWTFNDVEAGTAISDGDNEIVNRNGLYVRGRADGRAINAVASTLTSVTFSDNTEQTVSVVAQTAGANTATESTIGQNTAGRAAANALAPTFALNIATPGTFYAIMAPTKKADDRSINLFFSGKLVESKTVNDVYDATTDHLCELKYHAETTGVVYLSAGVASNLYAAMFIPDMEAGTEEDWNYQMLKTRENGWWTYTNMSGNSQSVPEGLTAYAVKEINDGGKAVLTEYGSVIANGAAVLVKGEADTEYALPSTTDEATYNGTNLLVANTTLRYLPATENDNTNYYFDGEKFVKATGGETIHEKQAYLNVASTAENILLPVEGEVTLNVTLDGTRRWATYYSDKHLAKPVGVTAYRVASVEGNTVNVEEVDYIKAHTGVLLYSETAVDEANLTVAPESGTDYTSELLGTVEAGTMTAGTNYVLYNNLFILAEDTTLPANRCYLHLADSSAAPAPRLTIKFGGNGEGTTSIGEVKGKTVEGRDLWYTIDGYQLQEKPTKKGLYIVNGRKVVIK